MATDWGGTPVEAWSSPDALKKCIKKEQYSPEKYSYKRIHSYICDQILENSSKSHMKSGVFLHVFNDISICALEFYVVL